LNDETPLRILQLGPTPQYWTLSLLPLPLPVLHLWRLPERLEIHPLGHKCGDELSPVQDSRNVQVLCVVVHLVPDARKRGRDHMQDLDAAGHEGDMVVLHAPAPAEVFRVFDGVKEPGFGG
jgi:hypothetical protein